jgi:6-phosphogluconolactonase
MRVKRITEAAGDRNAAIKAAIRTMCNDENPCFYRNITIERFPDAVAAGTALAQKVGERLARGLAAKGHAALAVPGGRTPGHFLAALFSQPLDWSRVTLVLTDVRWAASDSPDSNRRMLSGHLAGSLAAPVRRVDFDTAAGTPQQAAPELSRRLMRELPGPFDAVVAGMGADGHVASLFPGQPLDDNGGACVPGLAPAAPRLRISLSLTRLTDTAALFLLFGGQEKLTVLREGQGLPVHSLLAGAPADTAVFYFDT